MKSTNGTCFFFPIGFYGVKQSNSFDIITYHYVSSLKVLLPTVCGKYESSNFLKHNFAPLCLDMFTKKKLFHAFFW